MRYVRIFIILIIFMISPKAIAWEFDWSERTDHYGESAGIFTTTPFPITEASTTYSVKNDENPNGKTYTLGTKHYVDGNSGTDTGNCTTFESPCATIGYAITQASSGNKTIIVRGPYNGFDGIYSEALTVTTCDGTDDTHRFMIVGYGQERPILDGTGSKNILLRDYGVSYFTLQRIKLQNCEERGLYSTKSSYYNLIDVHLYNNCSQCYIDGNINADGSLHMVGTAADNVESPWFYHNTSEHTYMKCYKICDNTDNALVEWNVADECGYWSGIPNTPDSHPYGFDYAADGNSTNNSNLVMRYNIAGSALYGNECRYCPNFDIHHNEFYDCVHEDDFADDIGNWDHVANFMLRGDVSSGSFYANVVRDNDDTQKPHLLTVVGVEGTLYFYNNLIYNTTSAGYPVFFYTAENKYRDIYFYNNSLWGDTTTEIVSMSNVYPGLDTIVIKNNIIYQDGSGDCVVYDSDVIHDYNQYYAPGGAIGTSLEANELNSDPQWVQLPSSSYDINDAALQSISPGLNSGTDLSGAFTVDISNVSRPQSSAWDMGIYELQFGSITQGSGDIIQGSGTITGN